MAGRSAPGMNSTSAWRIVENGHAPTEKNSDEIENYVGVPLGPVLLDYLKSDHGHQLANRVVELLEGLKKATLDEQAKAKQQPGRRLRNRLKQRRARIGVEEGHIRRRDRAIVELEIVEFAIQALAVAGVGAEQQQVVNTARAGRPGVAGLEGAVDEKRGDAFRGVVRDDDVYPFALVDGALRMEGGLARAETGRTGVWIDDWSLVLEGSEYRASIAAQDFRFALAFAADQIVPQGQGGFSRKGHRAHEASYYYSRPQLEVAGTLDGRPVSGRAWLDHEWSSAYMAPEAAGWVQCRSRCQG